MASIVSAGTTSATALNMSADTTGILQLASNNGTVGLTMDTSQNVGIGTSSPATLLDLARSSTTGNDVSMPLLFVRNTNATQGNGGSTFNQAVVSVSAGNSAVGGGLRAAYDSGGSYGTGMQLYVNSTNPLQFYTNGTEKVRINSSGNIGVATSSPVALLDMNRGVFGNRLPSAAGASINFSGGFTTGGVTAVSTMLTVNFGAASYFSCALHIFSIGYTLNGGGSPNSAQTAAYDIVNIIRQSTDYVSYNITRVSGPTLSSGASNTWSITGAIASNVFTLTGSSTNGGQCGFTFGGYMVYGGQGTGSTNIILTTKDGSTNSTWGA
jgi:hypothetical protein